MIPLAALVWLLHFMLFAPAGEPIPPQRVDALPSMVTPAAAIHDAAQGKHQQSIIPRRIRRIPTLSIPSIDVRVSITTFYLDGTSWAIDPWEHRAGHFQGTAWTDQTGNVVIGGHAQYPDGSAGVFGRLDDLAIGDRIILMDETGRRWRYKVREIRSVRADDLRVIYPTTTDRLTLVTCDVPTYNGVEYVRRLVVIAEPQ